MTGGVRIESEKQARRFLRLHDVDEVTVGQVLQLQPCESKEVLAVIQEREGRPCPRVEIEYDNKAAASLASLTLASHLNPLVGPLYEAASADMVVDKRFGLVLRVANALQDEKVTDLLEAARQRAMDNAKAQSKRH